MSKSLSEIEESINKLKEKKIPNSQTVENGKVDKRKFNIRNPNSGRKVKEVNLIARGIKGYLDAHFNEKVKISIQDPKTGKTRTISKPRTIVALEALFNIGMKDKSSDALNKWLDRSLGRPATILKGSESEPIVLRIDI